MKEETYRKAAAIQTELEAAEGFKQMLSDDGVFLGSGAQSLGAFRGWSGPQLFLTDGLKLQLRRFIDERIAMVREEFRAL